MSGGTIHTVLADDHPFARRGVRETLAETTGIEVVAEVGSGAEALDVRRPQRVIRWTFWRRT